MLHTSLSLAFLATAPPPPLPVDPADLLPEDSMVVLEFGDLAALASTPEEDRGSWLRALLDERVREALVEASELNDEEAEMLRGLVALAAEVRGGALGVLDLDQGHMLAVLDTTEDFLPSLTETFADAGFPLEETERFGARTLVDSLDDEFTSVVVVELEDQVVLGLGLTGEILGDVEALVARTRAGEATEGWWTGADRGGLDVQIGVHLDLTALPMPAEVALTLGEVVDSAYFGIGVGDGHAGTLVASARLVRNEVTEAFAEALAEDVDPDLILGAPEGVETAQVAQLDVPSLVDAFVLMVDAIEPGLDAAASWDAALEAGSSFLGMDIEDDLLGNLSGAVFGYQWEIDDPEGYYVDEDDDAMIAAFPVLGFGLLDEEPFLELVEMLAPFTAEVGGELDEYDDATVLRLEPEPGVELLVRVGNGHLMFGTDAGRMEAVVARLGRTDFEGAVDEATFEAMTSELGGAALGVYGMAGMFDALRAVSRMDEELTEGDLALFDTVLDAFEENVGGRLMADSWMRADGLGFRLLTR